MSCINDISYKILLSQTSLKESEKFIKDNSDAFFMCHQDLKYLELK
ncbi:MAG: DUF1894 domain-containing protein [Methanosarcinales archaeon]|nr:DUF1894 domain-containing protein [Methanosarcinales archaeon]